MRSLLEVGFYLLIGFVEWFLALRRTLAVARGEKILLIGLVFVENLLGLYVLSTFVRSNNWAIAICYSIGASLGALVIGCRNRNKN